MALQAGMWIFAEDGTTVLFDPFTSNVTVIGTIETGKNNGSISHPMFARGRPVVVTALPVAGSGYTVPDIVISGTTISWAFKANGANYNQSCKITFGVRA